MLTRKLTILFLGIAMIALSLCSCAKENVATTATKKEGSTKVANNDTKSKTDSGLEYIVLKEGEGERLIPFIKKLL